MQPMSGSFVAMTSSSSPGCCSSAAGGQAETSFELKTLDRNDCFVAAGGADGCFVVAGGADGAGAGFSSLAGGGLVALAGGGFVASAATRVDGAGRGFASGSDAGFSLVVGVLFFEAAMVARTAGGGGRGPSSSASATLLGFRPAAAAVPPRAKSSGTGDSVAPGTALRTGGGCGMLRLCSGGFDASLALGPKPKPGPRLVSVPGCKLSRVPVGEPALLFEGGFGVTVGADLGVGSVERCCTMPGPVPRMRRASSRRYHMSSSRHTSRTLR